MVAKSTPTCTPSSEADTRDVQRLHQALVLAAQRRGFCAPNPAVGAVIVHGDQVVGEGWHHAPGMPHAEVVAIQQAGEQARGGILYVTLEPCSHQGRTPPCVDAIKAAGIARVVYAHRDPNPTVRAKDSATLLQADGIDCDVCPVPEITFFYAAYDYWTPSKMPWVTAKYAMSQDGKVALAGGKPTAITSDLANQHTHECRYFSDCILTTATTIQADDPLLNVRLASSTFSKPLAIVDTHAVTPLTARCIEAAASVRLYYSDAPSDRIEALQEKGVACVAVPAVSAGVDLEAVLEDLGQQGYHDVWVEAGPTLVDALLQAKKLHALIRYTAPMCLGESAMPGDLKHFHPGDFSSHASCMMGVDQYDRWLCDVAVSDLCPHWGVSTPINVNKNNKL